MIFEKLALAKLEIEDFFRDLVRIFYILVNNFAVYAFLFSVWKTFSYGPTGRHIDRYLDKPIGKGTESHILEGSDIRIKMKISPAL